MGWNGSTPVKEVAYGPDLHLKARGAAALLEPGRRSGGDCCAGRGRTARPPPSRRNVAGEDAPAPAATLLVDAFIVWITPDRQLKPGLNRFEVRVSEAARAPDTDRRPPARRPSPRGLPRRAPRPGPAGRVLPEHGPRGAPADGPGARAAGGPGDDQAAHRGRGAPALDVLHTFRAMGITAYLSNGGTLEHAQQIAGHRRRRRRSSTTGRRYRDGRRDPRCCRPPGAG